MAEKKYGHFDDDNREYVITDPQTPWPWINYLGNEDFFSLISNTAGGYSFYKDAKFRRITRYRYNGVPMDNGGRYFYIKDGDTVWNPGWKPCKTPLDSYECRHGMNYTRITGSKNGVEASVLFFVPLHTWAEVQKMTLKNQSQETKTLKVFSFAEWCLWNAATDMENFQRNFSTGEVEVEGSTIYHKTEYRERRDHYAVFWANAPVTSFDTSRDAFCGVYGGPAAPEAVKAGHCSNSIAHGWAPVGAHHFHLTLAPGEKKSIIFGLGYIENPVREKFSAPGMINKARAEAMMARYATDAQVDEALAKLNELQEQQKKAALPAVELEPYVEDEVDFDTFLKSDFRAVKIKNCEAVKKSDKLLKFTLDDGSGTDRIILSGIHQYYEPEQLIGKTAIAILNLPPRKMMGIPSCGMLISAVHHENGEEKLHLLMVDPHITAGAKLY